jgi:hypothetical protein
MIGHHCLCCSSFVHHGDVFRWLSPCVIMFVAGCLLEGEVVTHTPSKLQQGCGIHYKPAIHGTQPQTGFNEGRQSKYIPIKDQ